MAFFCTTLRLAKRRRGEGYSAFYWPNGSEMFIGYIADFAACEIFETTTAHSGKATNRPVVLCLGITAFIELPFLELGITQYRLLGEEILHRPYLTLGMACWLILLALAATSTRKLQQWMGRRWQTLHNGVYLVAILAPVHYIWSVKILSPLPLLYAGAAFLLLIWRYKTFRQWFRRR